MSAVIDSSVLVAALIDAGPLGDWALDVLAAGGLCAPELILVEATNVLRRLERSKAITNLEAEAAHHDLMDLGILLFDFRPFADRIWELRHNVTSYDAWYIAIAEALDLPLATLDEKLSKASTTACKFLTPAGSGPSQYLR